MKTVIKFQEKMVSFFLIEEMNRQSIVSYKTILSVIISKQS